MFWKKSDDSKGDDGTGNETGARAHKMDDNEVDIQSLYQKLMNGNDRSVPKYMMLNVPGFPLSVDRLNLCGDGHPTAIAKGKALAEMFRDAQLEWVNEQDENVPKWVEVPVKIGGIEVFFLLWLFNQCQLREGAMLEDTPEKFISPIPNEDIGDFLSEFIRAIVVDAIMDHSTQLSNEVHPLTRYRRAQQ